MAAEFSVLIIDSEPQTISELQQLLTRDPALVVLGSATTGRDGLAQAEALQPRIILLSADLRDADSAQIALRLSALLPSSAVVVTFRNVTTQLVRQYMVVGARGFLTKPVQLAELTKTLTDVKDYLAAERLAERQKAEAAAKPLGLVCAIFGGKGGVGKTTICVNVAAELAANRRNRVGVFDADFAFGDLTLQLNVEPRRTVLDFARRTGEAGAADEELVSALMTPHSSGVSALLGPQRPEYNELITVKHVKELLAVLPRMFDFLVIDCAQSYDERSLAILDRADVILQVLTPEVGPVRNTRLFLDTAQSLGYEPNKIALVVNRVDSRVGIDLKDIEHTMGREILFPIASGGRQVVRSVNLGQPLVLTDRNSQTSRDIRLIAEYLVRQKAALAKSGGA